MKITADFPASSNTQDNPREPVRLVWPDSCWLLSDRPLYVPDFAKEFNVVVMAAFKSNRLGKNISQRFAPRYLTEYSVALIVLPQEAVEAIDKGDTIPTRHYIFDNAVVLGDWQPVPPSGLKIIASAPGRDREVSEVTSIPSMPEAAATLNSVSLCNTVKMGDVLLLPVRHSPILIYENLQITITDNQSGKTFLTTRFK